MNEHPLQTAVIYARVSSKEQVSGTSLDMQVRLCKEYAKREGLQVISTFVEEGESAKTAHRTEFQKALAFCANKKQKVDYFIVHKLDRFARNQDDHVTTQAFLRRYGTKLRSVTEQIDESPVGKMMEGVLATFAEFDNNIRSARSKSGMIERAKQGVWIWQAPLGYKRLTKGGNLVLDDGTAPYIRQAFEKWAEGTYSYKSLAAFLAERGFRTRKGKKPLPQLMEKVLKNPVYAGIIRQTEWGVERQGLFPPIVDPELFEKCQPNSQRKAHAGPRLQANPDFSLRKFVICPDCQRPLTASFSRGRHGGRYGYYHHQVSGCSKAAYIPKETFEQNFTEFLADVSPRGKYEKIFKEVVLDVWQSNYRRLDAENARVRREIETLEGERQRVFDLHRFGTYDDREFMEQKALVNRTITQKKLLLDEKRVEEFDMEEALAYCFNFVRESARTWRELRDLPAHRVRFQKQAFPENLTFDGEKFGTPKMSLVYELNKGETTEKSQLVTEVGRNWNPLVQELSSWLAFGRDIERAREIA